MRALLRTGRADDELATVLARAGLYVERVAGRAEAEGRLARADVAVVDPRLLSPEAPAAPAPRSGRRSPLDAAALAERSLEEVCYVRLSAFLDRLGNERLPLLHATVMAETERALLRLALERAGGVAAAAELLGIHRNTLARRLEELGLRRRQSRARPAPAAGRGRGTRRAG